jgi:antitoxin HigA-1
MDAYNVIGKSGKVIDSKVLLHPGELLAMEIEARGLKKSDFADALGIRPGNLSELLNGRRHISALVALKLEALLKISASFWLRLQSDYDLSVAKQGLPNSLHSKLFKRKLLLDRKRKVPA